MIARHVWTEEAFLRGRRDWCFWSRYELILPRGGEIFKARRRVCLSGNRKLETTTDFCACRENALIHSSTRLLSITTVCRRATFSRSLLLFPFSRSLPWCECLPVFVHVQYFFSSTPPLSLPLPVAVLAYQARRDNERFQFCLYLSLS